ncbi:MAG: uracil-DNA glycosylase [Myxococcota bacterium]
MEFSIATRALTVTHIKEDWLAMTQPPTAAQRKQELGLIARALRKYLIWQHELGADGAPHPTPEAIALHEAQIRQAQQRAFAQEMAEPTPSPATTTAGSPPPKPHKTTPDPPQRSRPQIPPPHQEPSPSANPNRGNIYRFTDLAQTSLTKPRQRRPSAASTPQDSALARLAVAQQALEGCQRCGLCRGRRNIVFGAGGPAPRLVFIGAAPGVNEDRRGRPFVGKAGQLLSRMIKAMNLDRKEVYVCHTVKCRPPGNRAPRPDELATCRPVFEEQLSIIAPEAVVTLGEQAARSVLQTQHTLDQLQGQWHTWTSSDGSQKFRVMPTLHPDHLLRHPEDKRHVWQHLQKVMTLLNLKAPSS